MKSKQILLLLIAAVAVLATAVFLYRAEQTRYTSADGELLFPELASQLDDITRIELRRGTEQQITLVQTASGWGVEERKGYPANRKNIRRLLVNLGEMQLEEPKTASPERHTALAVGDPQQDGNARLVRLLDGNGNAVAEVILGNTARGRGQYLRLPDSNQSWLGSESLSFGVSFSEWLDRKLLDINQTEVQRLDMQPASGREYSVLRTDNGSLKLEPEAPAGKRIKPGMLNRLTAVLQNLSADDVHMQAPRAGDWATARHTLSSGVVITLSSQPRPADTNLPALLQISAQATDEADEAAIQRAAELNARLSGWVFEIPNHQSLMMGQPWDKVIEATQE